MRVLGIDEAGRGCVFGPLVVAGFLYEGEPERLVEAGATDSKKLSAKRRIAARAGLSELGRAEIRPIPATAIDTGNLNELEEEAIVALVAELRPDHVILDALGHPSTIPATTRRLAHAVGSHGLSPTWHMQPKADLEFPVVGAASIFAKTTRDGALDQLRDQFGELGSGYPSDPKVKKWLADWHATGEAWPAFVRTRWATVRAFGQLELPS